MYEELIERLRGYVRAYTNDNPYDIPSEVLKAVAAIKHLQSELEQERQKNILLQANADWFKAERDKAVEMLKKYGIECAGCIHITKPTGCEESDYMCDSCGIQCPCKECRGNSNWQWEGLEGGGESN